MKASQDSETAPNFEFDALRAADNYRHSLLREFRPHLRGRVIEVGAGIGQMTQLLRGLTTVERLLCIEPDSALCREFRHSLPDQPLLEGTVNLLPGTERSGWNAIISVNVLEHIQEDEAELTEYARLLREAGGRLCLFVPARPEIYAPIDADFGHFRRYTRQELKRKLGVAGFEIVRLDYFNFIGYFAWWFSFRLLKQRKFNPAQVRLFDRFIFPVVNLLESRVARPPFGQSLICVASARQK